MFRPASLLILGCSVALLLPQRACADDLLKLATGAAANWEN
jgi:hypothetical protein